MILHPGPKGFFVRNYGSVALFALLLILGGIAVPFIGLDFSISGLLWAVGLLILGVTVAHTLLHDRHTSLFLSEEELVFETGIVNHSVKRVPIHKISDTSTEQDFLDKLIGSCNLRINTPGSQGYEVEADGFNYKQIKSFTDELYKLIHVTPDSLPDKDSVPKQK